MSAEHPVQEGLRRRSANVNALWFLPHSLLIKKSPQEHSQLAQPQALCYGNRVSSLPSTPFPGRQWWYQPAHASLWKLTVLISSQLCVQCPPIDSLISAMAVFTLQESKRPSPRLVHQHAPAGGLPFSTVLLTQARPEPMREAGGWTPWGMLGVLSRAFQLLMWGQSQPTDSQMPLIF